MDNRVEPSPEPDPVIEAARWLRGCFPKPGTLPPTCALAALSLAASVLLVALVDLPAEYHPHKIIDSRPVPPVLLLAWPAVWVPAFAAVLIPRLGTAIAPWIAAASGLSIAAAPVLILAIGLMIRGELIAACALVALNGAAALVTLNLRMLTWALTVATLLILAWGTFVTSLTFAYGAPFYGFLWWEATMLFVVVLGMLAFWTAKRFVESMVYLVASPTVNLFWVVIQLELSLIDGWLVIPLAVALNVGYVYFAWRYVLRKQPAEREQSSDVEPRRAPLQC